MSKILGCFILKMEAAKSAAFVAPAFPIASVPTGTPAGICTIESSESNPFSARDCIGMPNTGKQVLAAIAPGRAAAPPAAAISTSKPRFEAVSVYSTS